jgi:tetratricopeptide (TPR) repeat protein
MAYAAKSDLLRAEAERAAFEEASKAVGEVPMGLNDWAGVSPIARHLLTGRIALSAGDVKAGVAALRQAVAAQDALAYDEPPGWPWPARESLGRALLLAGDLAGAEAVFREDLVRNPRNPRSLFGLAEALRGQGKGEEAAAATRDFEAAWKDADTGLTVDDL